MKRRIQLPAVGRFGYVLRIRDAQLYRRMGKHLRNLTARNSFDGVVVPTLQTLVELRPDGRGREMDSASRLAGLVGRRLRRRRLGGKRIQRLLFRDNQSDAPGPFVMGRTGMMKEEVVCKTA